MGDVFDATAYQGFRADEPYPNGLYDCRLDYTFSSGSSGIFTLEMIKIEASDWYMTSSDFMDDLEALWYATMWFEETAAGVPEMDVDVYKVDRQSSGGKGASFLASRGSVTFALTGTANMSNA